MYSLWNNREGKPRMETESLGSTDGPAEGVDHTVLVNIITYLYGCCCWDSVSWRIFLLVPLSSPFPQSTNQPVLPTPTSIRASRAQPRRNPPSSLTRKEFSHFPRSNNILSTSPILHDYVFR